MGNHPSAANERSSKKSGSTGQTTATNDTSTNVPSSFENPAIEGLAKILSQKSADEYCVQGISGKAFTTVLFPQYVDLGQRIFAYFSGSRNSNESTIPSPEFIAETSKFITTIADEEIVNLYLKIYGDNDTEIYQGSFRELIKTAGNIAMDHYPKGPKKCEKFEKTIQSVVAGAFHGKNSAPISFIKKWLPENCPYLLPGLHKYTVHVLTTAHRNPISNREAILEKSTDPEPDNTMPVSLLWILSTSLPTLYNKAAANASQQSSTAAEAPKPTTLQILVNMMTVPLPTHWQPLYDSNAHGLGSNRFLTHVLNYKSPTLTFLYTENSSFLLATGMEWRESQNYWGGPDCFIIQISPEYHVIEHGEKLMSLNFSIRGYPMGIRAGSNSKSPSIAVDADLSTLTFQKIPHKLDSIEVWGCGKEEDREQQLEVKKWQVKEAEKQRVVKLNADDWLDHPDRYLLEMNGRANYREADAPEPKKVD